jgi:hypothetical protein
MGHYVYDPASGKSDYTGNVGLSHYATVVHDNKMWLSGYPGSKLFVFDCTKPISLSSGGPSAGAVSADAAGNNPRMLGNLSKSKCHKMYGAAVGASGLIYFGGRWMRTGNGGGLGWWDPKTNKEDGIWEEFSAQMITHLTATDGGKYIAISTRKVQDITLKKPTPNEGKLFVFDDAKKKIIHEITVVEGIDGPGAIAWAGGHRVIGWTHDPANPEKSILYGVDAEKGTVVWRIPLPFKLPLKIGGNQEEAWDFRLAPDGNIWTFMGTDGKTLVRIDPKTAKIEAITKVDRAGKIAFSGNDVYLAGTKSLRRIRGVAR